MPDLEERRQLIQKYHELNGDPEEFDREDTYEIFTDFCLMSYFSHLFCNNDIAQSSARSICSTPPLASPTILEENLPDMA